MTKNSLEELSKGLKEQGIENYAVIDKNSIAINADASNLVSLSCKRDYYPVSVKPQKKGPSHTMECLGYEIVLKEMRPFFADDKTTNPIPNGTSKINISENNQITATFLEKPNISYTSEEPGSSHKSTQDSESLQIKISGSTTDTVIISGSFDIKMDDLPQMCILQMTPAGSSPF